MGRRVPKLGIRIGNSLTWKTTYHSTKINSKRSWYFEEALIKKIIKGINRRFNYYVSSIIIHTFPKTGKKMTIHIKYLVWNEDDLKTKDVHYITSQIISPLLAFIFQNYLIKYDVKVINKSMIYQDAEMLGDYLGDKLMAEPHRDKQIITREFRRAAEEIKKTSSY